MAEPTDAEILSLRVSAAAMILAASYRDPDAFVPLDYVYRDADFRPATRDEIESDEAQLWRKRSGWWFVESGRDFTKLFVLRESLVEIASREAVDRADAIIKRCLQNPLKEADRGS